MRILRQIKLPIMKLLSDRWPSNVKYQLLWLGQVPIIPGTFFVPFFYPKCKSCVSVCVTGRIHHHLSSLATIFPVPPTPMKYWKKNNLSLYKNSKTKFPLGFTKEAVVERCCGSPSFSDRPPGGWKQNWTLLCTVMKLDVSREESLVVIKQ